MCEDTPAWPAEDLACEPGQEPRGCRYIAGDVLDKENPWRYCQAEMLPGHHPGNLAKPPYCAEHMRLVATPLTEAGRRSRAKFLERIAGGDLPGELFMEAVAQNGSGEWNVPVDMYVRYDSGTKLKGHTHD